MRATTAVPVFVAPTRHSSDHRFYVASAVVSLVLVIVSFGPGLVDPASRRGPLTPLVVAHAVTFTGWLVLYLVQTVLAATGRLRWHRRLGVVGVVLAAVMMVVGYQTSIDMVRRGFDLSGDLERNGPVILQTSFQLWGVPLFGGLVLAAVLNRRRPDVHKRLMWLTIPGVLIGAPIVHAIGHYGLPPVVAPLANFSLLAANPLHDRITHGRMHPVSLWGGVFFVILANTLAAVISPSPTWHRFVLWLAG
jgi:hypothetical protein